MRLEGHQQGMQIISYYNIWKQRVKMIQELEFSWERECQENLDYLQVLKIW